MPISAMVLEKDQDRYELPIRHDVKNSSNDLKLVVVIHIYKLSRSQQPVTHISETAISFS